MDRSLVLAEILKSVRDGDFPVISTESLPTLKGVQMSVSRFEIKQSGYLLWVEFSVPDQTFGCPQVTVGTLELAISHSGVVASRVATGHTMRTQTT